MYIYVFVSVTISCKKGSYFEKKMKFSKCDDFKAEFQSYPFLYNLSSFLCKCKQNGQSQRDITTCGPTITLFCADSLFVKGQSFTNECS